MTFIDITCMSDRSEEVIIETFPRRNDTPFFTTRSCRLNGAKSGRNEVWTATSSPLRSDQADPSGLSRRADIQSQCMDTYLFSMCVV